jgi:fucose permease
MDSIKPNYKRTKLACYTSYFTMSSIFSMPPLLFLTFRELYGISYTLLGTLVLANFFTQLAVDLVFTAFSKHFNVKWVVRIMPIITFVGLAIYSLVPFIFVGCEFVGLLIGTVIFSVSAGLSEVLLSPTIAAIPSKTPERDMSFLHSLYAFGFVSVVIVTTVYIKLFGAHNWMYLSMFFSLLPLIASVMFMLSPMPEMRGDTEVNVKTGKKPILGLALCVGCIFFGSCAETVMSNWISSYTENALGVDKALGDILGMATFAILLGLTRMGYGKFGKGITPVLFVGMAGSAVCYLTVALSESAILALIACILTGAFTAMLWPGALIFMEKNVKGVGVGAFALMASGGDLGAALSPQLMGIISDSVAASSFAAKYAPALGITQEQLGMRAGMLTTALFPLLGVILLTVAVRYFKKGEKSLMPLDTSL